LQGKVGGTAKIKAKTSGSIQIVANAVTLQQQKKSDPKIAFLYTIIVMTISALLQRGYQF
jgi:hypothetical protein